MDIVNIYNFKGNSQLFSVGGYGWLLVLIIFLLAFILRRKGVSKPGGNKYSVPVVSGQLPLIGHGLYFSKDILGFMSDCQRRYGQVFQIKIFHKTMVVICDQALTASFFKQPEETMSLVDALVDLNFDWLLTRPSFSFSELSSFLRKTLSFDTKSLIPFMETEVGGMIRDIKGRIQKNGDSHAICAEELSHRFIARTSHTSFIGGELNDEDWRNMRRFYGFANTLIIASSFIPSFLTKLVFGAKVERQRRKITSKFVPLIQAHRDDPSKSDSILIRKGIDEGMEDEDIRNLLSVFMFVSTENTAVGLANSLVFLTRPENKEILEELREECENKGSDALVSQCPLLHACVIETARLTVHPFSIVRKPPKEGMQIGEYWIGGEVDSIALSGQQLMVQGQSAQRFKDPLDFNPHRFLGKDKASEGSPNIVTWGGGHHLCPGRSFALMEIKLALAHLVLNFELGLEATPTPFQYTTPVALGKTKARLVFRERNKE